MNVTTLKEPVRPTGRVHSLIIDNFKSYKGKEVIGPFKDFTTVIGPNGSGKSNLMDAISFVLGVRSSVLRGSSLGELIYSSGTGESTPGKDRAEVTLVFEHGTGASKDQLRFSRAIVPSSSGTGFASQYRLDGKTVTADAYNLKLESFGILVKARNFLVFQGDIENVAQMSPKDLTNLFETISGSAAHKKAYEAAEARLKDAESSMAVVFSKRKAIMAEKRQKKEQKTEAEKHMALMSQLEEMKIKKILWKLYHLMEDQRKAEEALSGLKQQMGMAEKEVRAAEENAEQKKRKHAGVAKEALLIDKKIRKKKNEMEKKSPEMIKIKEQIAHIERRIKAVTREQEAVRAKGQEHAARVNNLRTQLAQLKDAQAQVDEEIETNKKSQLSLSPDLLKEYADIKRAYGGKAATLEAELASLQASAQADEESLRMINDANASIDKRIEHLEESLEKDAAKMGAAKAAIEKIDTDRAAVVKQRDDLRSEHRAVEAKKSHLERKLEETEGTLRDAKAESKQSQREEAMRSLVAELRKENPSSVYGIVTDLADPTSTKYKLAMSVVMGRDIDSVVVDTPETAMKCIEKVKQRRLPPMTFLPADTIRLREVNPALRTLGGTSKLAIDCLNIKDERATRAFKSICADALLCDTVDEARRLAYDGAVRQRVIALDGTAFLKNGLITGGMTSAMEDRARKWDQERVGKLKEARNGLAKELLGLPQLRDITQKLQSAEARSTRLDNEKNYATAELRSLKEKLKESNSNIAALSKEKASKEPTANTLRKQMSKLNAKIDEIKAKMDVIANSCFKDFVKKIGVSSIKEYEEKHLKAVERLTERRAAIISQYSRVENQLEYESSSHQDETMAKVSRELESLEKARADLEKEAAGFEAANKKSKEELIQLGKECDKLKKSLSVLDGEMKEMKEQARKVTDALAARHREISTLEMKIEQIKMQQNDQMEAADLENVILPIKTATMSSGAGKRRRGQDAAQASTSAPSAPSASSAFGGRKTDDLDFSSLGRDDLMRDSASKYSRETEMSAAIDELAAQLASMAPNLKAVEQFEEIKRREREQMEEVERTKRDAKVIEDEYNRLRQLRYDLFSAALTHISECIDPIYKELTRSNLHPSGGQAYLSPENTEEPFNGGIKFSAMPPTKRFRDMEQLSGGEKTVAALALLFAVHSFHPSPFFVLDEIDAALDSSNVARVALYLRSKTRANAHGAFQGIVISLKDVFYANADALVGVCRAKSTNASTTLTFDLERFEAPVIRMMIRRALARSYSTLKSSGSLIPNDGLTFADFVRPQVVPSTLTAPLPSASPSHAAEAPGGISYFIETYGCQMNQNDTDIVTTILNQSGYVKSPSAEESDVVLLNTCAIRDNAESKIWQRLGYFRNARREQPKRSRRGPIVGVLGCMAERLKEKLLEDKMASLVVGPDAYRDLPRLIDVVRPAPGAENNIDRAMNVQLSIDETYADITPVREASDVSVFVSIMRGCNQNCSYCIVPRTRGRERSRAVSSILEEVKYLAEVGTKEIWLLGQNVNSYCYFGEGSSRPTRADPSRDYYADFYAKGFRSVYKPLRDGSQRFADLLHAVADVSPEMRVRFTSPHPKDFSDDVIQAIKQHDNICKQIHMPAQHGDSSMLERMNRGYTRQAYDDLVAHIRSSIPGIALSTDMIAGFCGETEEEHSASVDLLRKAQFDNAFLFAYSMRDKTPAARHLVDDVPEATKKRRLQELIDTYREGLRRISAAEIGATHIVLVEGPSRKSSAAQPELTGRTDTFKRVVFPKVCVPASLRGDNARDHVALRAGDFVAVEITAAGGGATLVGRPIARTTMREYFDTYIRC